MRFRKRHHDIENLIDNERSKLVSRSNVFQRLPTNTQSPKEKHKQLSENKEMDMKRRIWTKGTRITANIRANKTGIVVGDKNQS